MDRAEGAALSAIVLGYERRLRQMGNETAVAFGQDGRVLLVKTGDPASVRFEDDEVDRLFGAAVFTHNHPGDRSFSVKDVELACTLEWGELRAVGPTWTHVMRPGEELWNDRFWLDRLQDESARSEMYVRDQVREDLRRGRVTIDEAEAEYWHMVWERAAATVDLDYQRYSGERSDAS